MTRYKKKMLILAMALIVCAVSILPWTQVAYATPDAEPTKTTIADKLILQLGPDWAGVEFELVTDVGKYPGTIVVDNTGVLALELSDSSTFTLSCLNSKVTPPKPALQEPDEQATEPIKPHIFGATDLVQPSESPQANNRMRISLTILQHSPRRNRSHHPSNLSKESQRCNWCCF